MSRADVVVVGAGASGLAVAATLKRRGIAAVVLDRDSQVGGTWARRYDRLHLHTIRSLSGLPFQPIPSTAPRYVPSKDYARYLAEYAERQGLDVRLGVHVHRVSHDMTQAVATAVAERPLTVDWLVATSAGEWRARVLVVATGRHNIPRLPHWPGAEGFRGRLLHSHDYRSGREFGGQRALVVGIGNSGAEIATDLVECGASSVAIAVRTPPPITSREIAGIPVQLLGMLFKPFPAAFVDWLGKGLRRIGTGDLRPYGLSEEKWGPFAAKRPPVIDVGFLAQLRAGRIAVRPDVARFTADGVVFADGSELPVDVVVAATGYASGLPEMIETPDCLDGRGLPTSRPELSGLYFAGYAESPRGQLYESARDAHPLARSIGKHLARKGASSA